MTNERTNPRRLLSLINESSSDGVHPVFEQTFKRTVKKINIFQQPETIQLPLPVVVCESNDWMHNFKIINDGNATIEKIKLNNSQEIIYYVQGIEDKNNGFINKQNGLALFFQRKLEMSRPPQQGTMFLFESKEDAQEYSDKENYRDWIVGKVLHNKDRFSRLTSTHLKEIKKLLTSNLKEGMVKIDEE